MKGRIDARRQAQLPITIRGPWGTVTLEAIVDTGFGGFLALPEDSIHRLGLRPDGAALMQSAGGQLDFRDTYRVQVDWQNGQRRGHAIASSLPAALVGTELLVGSRVTLDYGPAKSVEIE
jgi:predicted aspartyl protease